MQKDYPQLERAQCMVPVPFSSGAMQFTVDKRGQAPSIERIFRRASPTSSEQVPFNQLPYSK